MTRCPRCQRETSHAAPYCGACGAPLLLGDETVRPLDVALAPEAPTVDAASPLRSALDLDRRARRPVQAEPRGPPAAAGAATVAAPPPARPGRRQGDEVSAGDRGELAALERSHWQLGRAEATVGAAEVDVVPDVQVDVLEVHVERADTWRRAAAWAVDALPFCVAGFFVARDLVDAGRLAPAAGIDELLDLVARERVIVLSVAAVVTLALGVYATVAHALAGATLGKRLFRLRVVGPDGGRPSPARSAVRSALAVASAGMVGLGFVLALFTRSGRGLHDLIARTWVVKAP